MHCGKHPAVRWIPRLRRYKGKFPDPQWPGNAKLCVNIVLNYEEGGGRVQVGREQPYKSQLATNKKLLQCGQWGRAIGNGPSRGKPNCHKTYRLKLAYAVGKSILKSPDAARYLAQSGHEISSHGVAGLITMPCR